ncbi:ATP-binding cassette domain-containing protein [Propionibacterium acidifaciens]|nr:ATP-binding cassette domain-containing protein [Propionibacterium acidifaciens]
MTRPLRRRSPLRASGLTLSCRGPTLLRGLSFELRSDRVLVVTGASGVGKTTLLRAIAGTAAEAIAAAAVERSGRLGYVFQEPGAAPTALMHRAQERRPAGRRSRARRSRARRPGRRRVARPGGAG